MKKLMLILLGFISISFLAVDAYAASVIRVPSDQPTIEAAVEAAVNGDLVLVAPGTYNYQDINFLGKAITVKSEAGPEATILNSSGVYFSWGEGPASVFDGFTVIPYPSDPYGMGINMVWSSPTIRNCVIKDSKATNMTFGAVRIGGGKPLLENVKILNNANAGISIDTEGGPTIRNCLIAKNNAGIRILKGELWMNDRTITIVNSTITDNAASGIWLEDAASMSVNNSIVWNNAGGDISGSLSPDVQIGYSDIGRIDGQYSDQGGNINLQPVFVNAGADDYHLDNLSPGIDAGENATATPYDLDLAYLRYNDTGVVDTGKDNFIYPSVDMGAYEKHSNSSLKKQPPPKKIY